MTDIKFLQKYHALLKPYLGVFFIAIFFDICMTLVGLVTPLYTRVLFDWAYPFRDLNLLNLTIAAIIVTYFAYFFLSVVSDYLEIYITQDATATLSEKVFHAIQNLPLKFHQEKKTGDLLLRITDDAAGAVSMIVNILPTLIIDGGRFLIILVISMFINTRLTLLALVSVPLYCLEARFYAARLGKVEGENIVAESGIISRAEERLANIKTIKAFGQERNETLAFGRLLRLRFRVAVKGKFLEVIRTFTNSITLQLWSVFLMWYLGYQVVAGKLTIGEIVALMLYIEQLETPVRSFIALFTEWKTSLVSMRRIDEVLSEPAEDTKEARAQNLKLTEGKVMARHLSFEYAPDQKVLHGVEASFPPHSLTAIVGASGSGKTTLVNLLLKFFKPSDGMILIDGQNISEVRIHELRGKVGIVAQDAALFDGTVIENILYGSEAKERGDAMRVARLSGAHDFIVKLPGGYDAPVGREGGLLSSGERQRIAIARTLLRDPRIVIFDESTSALDAESEYHIQEAISALKKTKTVIVIAHRLSTIKSADKILVLEGGRFVEEGEFNELIERRGAFYRFYWRQFGGLAAFRTQLELELERSARYGSNFCVAVLKVKNILGIIDTQGQLVAERFMEALDLLLKKHMRIGDNSAILNTNTILMLLPEIDAGHLEQFFERLMRTLPDLTEKELPHTLAEDDIFLAGTHITKKIFRTPEELIHELNAMADLKIAGEGYSIIAQEEFANRKK